MAESKRFAEMTGAELWHKWWTFKGDEHASLAALRDAILAERDADHKEALMRATREADRADETATHWKRVAERAEQERDIARERTKARVQQCAEHQNEIVQLRADWERSVNAHNAAIRERDGAREQVYRLRDAFDAELAKARTADSALGEARREGAREALTALREYVSRLNTLNCVGGQLNDNTPKWAHRIVEDFRDKHYPATPSGEGEGPVIALSITDMSDGGQKVLIFAEDARRLVAMGQEAKR